MTFPIFRRAASMALFVASPCACNSSSPAATAFVTSYIQPAGGGTVCDYGTITEWINIGAPTGKDPTVVANGGNQGGGQPVSVGCTVHPDGAGFDVALNASLGDHGSITITSLSGKTISSSVDGTVAATFQSQKMGTWTSEKCTLSNQYLTGPVPRKDPVAAGRIWAHVSCLAAERNDGEMRGLPDGGIGLATCDTEADFLFEFCNE
jgi:hypothetical protein